MSVWADRTPRGAKFTVSTNEHAAKQIMIRRGLAGAVNQALAQCQTVLVSVDPGCFVAIRREIDRTFLVFCRDFERGEVQAAFMDEVIGDRPYLEVGANEASVPT